MQEVFVNSNSDQWVFFNEFMRNPFQIAAIQPSSRSFVQDVLADIPFERDAIFVEYGAGTGAVAKEICNQMTDDSVCIAVEPNHSFTDFMLQENTRLRVIQDFAENVTERILDLYGSADYILAGLPFSLMPEDRVQRLLAEAQILLGTDGELRLFFYAHSLAIPKIQRMIDSAFEKFRLTWTSISWNNVPPMAIVRCMN